MGRVSAGIGALALAVVAIPVAGAFAADDGEPKLDAAQLDQGRKLFVDSSCSQCHTLADAQAQGSVGPSLDGNAHLDKGFVVDRITNGSGPMPSFGWLAPEQIDLLASYVVQAKK